MNTKSLWVNSKNVGTLIQIKENRIHYARHEGKGCIILLHGLGHSMFSLRNIYEELIDKGYGVIAMDLPGSGYSSMNQKQKFAVEHLADIINSFMEALDIESAHFFGVAEGAIYAMCLSQLYPDKVTSLTLCSPGSLTRKYPFIYKQLIVPMFGEIFMKVFFCRETVGKYLRWLYFNKTKITPTIERQTFEPYNNKLTRLWFLYQLRDYNDSGVYSHLYLVGCDTLLIWGDFDYAHPIHMSEKLLGGIRKAKLIKLNNIGHMVHEQRAEAIVKEMVESLLEENNVIIPKERD